MKKSIKKLTLDWCYMLFPVNLALTRVVASRFDCCWAAKQISTHQGRDFVWLSGCAVLMWSFVVKVMWFHKHPMRRNTLFFYYNDSVLFLYRSSLLWYEQINQVLNFGRKCSVFTDEYRNLKSMIFVIQIKRAKHQFVLFSLVAWMYAGLIGQIGHAESCDYTHSYGDF